MITIEEIIKASGLHPTRVQNIYIFGSRVYGNATNNSDWDILIIAKTSSPEREIRIQIENGDDLNIHILTSDRFILGLTAHNIRNIECIMAPDWAKLKEDINFNFQLKLSSLRHEVSRMNSNSWVKCKKKLNQGDYYIGVKSIWHSMRIVMFGSQIARYGKIIDWGCANKIWDEIKSKKWTWEELDDRFRKYNNELLSGFRIFASIK